MIIQVKRINKRFLSLSPIFSNRRCFVPFSLLKDLQAGGLRHAEEMSLFLKKSARVRIRMKLKKKKGIKNDN